MVNFGVVGFGLHAVKRLMPGFALSQKCRVTALSRRDLGKAKTSAEQFNIPLAFDSAEQLCQSSEVDVVLVTTPNALHLQDVLTAIRHGKHVLCEKPMGIDAEQCRQMVEAARKASVLLGVAQVFRFEESTAWMREKIASGKIGRPVFARSEFSFPAQHGHARAWINDPVISGGGPISDVGVHCIDGLRFILQKEVTRVSASGSSDAISGALEAASAIVLEFADGTLGNVLVSFRAEYRTPIEFVGESAVLRADDVFNVERPIQVELRRGQNLLESVTLSNRLAYARQVDAFADAVEGKMPFACPGEEGRKNQLVLDAAYRSLKTHKTEEVGGIC